MELALNLGYKSLEELDNNMSVAEYGLWKQFNSQKLLPIRRMEYYLAQIASQVSYVFHALGGKSFPLKDFLLDVQVEQSAKQDTAETGAEVIGAMAGGVKVIHIGKKRKENGRVSR